MFLLGVVKVVKWPTFWKLFHIQLNQLKINSFQKVGHFAILTTPPFSLTSLIFFPIFLQNIPLPTQKR